MSDKNSSNKISLYNRWLNGIEAVGNKLPHPVALFAMLALLIILISAICAALGVSATGELVSDGELKETTVTAVSLLTKDGPGLHLQQRREQLYQLCAFGHGAGCHAGRGRGRALGPD